MRKSFERFGDEGIQKKTPFQLFRTKREQSFLRAEHMARYIFACQYAQQKMVLDVASGSGYGSFYLATHGALAVVGVELEEEAVRQALLKFHHSNLIYKNDRAEELLSVPESFDCIVSFETIEHIEKDEQFLFKINQKLLPDGKFIISTPNRNISNPGKSLTDKPENPYHVREYTQDEFRQLVQRYFHIEESYGQGVYRKQSVWSNRFLRNMKTLVLITGIGMFFFSRIRKTDNFFEPTYCIFVCTKK